MFESCCLHKRVKISEVLEDRKYFKMHFELRNEGLSITKIKRYKEVPNLSHFFHPYMPSETMLCITSRLNLSLTIPTYYASGFDYLCMFHK